MVAPAQFAMVRIPWSLRPLIFIFFIVRLEQRPYQTDAGVPLSGEHGMAFICLNLMIQRICFLPFDHEGGAHVVLQIRLVCNVHALVRDLELCA